MGFDGENLFIAGNYRVAEKNTGWIIFSVTIAGPAAAPCRGKVETIRATPESRITFGEPLEIEISLSESRLFLTVVAYNRELGEEFLLFNSAAESETVNIAVNLPAGNYTIFVYLEGKAECKTRSLGDGDSKKPS